MLPDLPGRTHSGRDGQHSVLVPHIKSGAVTAVAVSTIKRSPILPNVPALAESGIAALNGFDTGGWFSMYTTLKTPPGIVEKLNGEILALLERADARDRLLTFGATPLPGTPDDLRRQLAREVPRWRESDSGRRHQGGVTSISASRRSA